MMGILVRTTVFRSQQEVICEQTIWQPARSSRWRYFGRGCEYWFLVPTEMKSRCGLTEAIAVTAAGVDVGRVHLGVADDTNLLGGLELLPGEAKETGLEVAGDAVVGDRTLQPVPEKRIIQPVATGAETIHTGRLEAKG
jgi:hypothetical protein